MKFVPFARLSEFLQESVALAPRPRVHLEPIVLHSESRTETMVAIHLQIGDSHALLMEDDLQDFLDQFNLSVAKLEERSKPRTH